MQKHTFLLFLVFLLSYTVKSQNTAKDICSPITVFPFSESFNDTTFAPNCWKNYENDGTATTNIWKRVTTGTNPTCLPHSGVGMLLFDCWYYAEGVKALLVTPAQNIPSDSYQVDFWMYRDNGFLTNADSVNVYISSDTNLTGATLIGTIHRSIALNPVEPLSNQWYHYTFNLPVGSAGTNKHIIIEGVSMYGSNIFIDDIKVSETPACPLPSACNVTSVSGSTATIGWNSSGSVASWDIEYGLPGFTLGSGTTINTTTNPVTLTGLARVTNYSYYVRSNCGVTEGSSEWSGPHFFTTVCDPVSIFPYTESFDDSVTFVPTCWKNIQTGGTGTSLIWTRLKVGTTPSASAHSGAGMASFNSRTYAAGTKAILVSPELDLSAKNHQISFWMFRDNGYLSTNDSLNVYYNINPNTTGATLLGTINRAFTFSPIEATPNKWYHYSFIIPQEVALSNKYIILEGSSKKGNSIYVDDLKIDTVGNCVQPFALIAKAIADTGATLKWGSTGAPVSWNVEYGVGNFIQGTGTILNSDADSLVLANLSQNTEYSFYVQANCDGSNEVSSWAGPNYFKTLISCPSPTALTVSNILDSSATISWIPGGTETTWNLECVINGAAQNTGTIIATNTNSYTITGLTPNTSYNFYIQADCGGNDSSSTWASSSVFTTLCTPISAFPFTESFDGTTFPPGCWKNISSPSYLTYIWNRATSGTSPTCTPHSGAGMANYPYTTYSGTGATLITPPINLPSDFYVAKFWMFRDNGLPLKDDSINVYYNTVPDYNSNAVLLGTIHRNNSKYPVESTANQWYQYSFQLPVGSAGNNRFILVDVKRNAGTNIYIDDFIVEEQPPCHSPVNLSVIAIKNTEATVTWTARSGETSWNIEYGPLGFIKGTGTVIASNTNPTTLTGLNPSTNYSFYVQANCGGVEGMSIWTGPYTFKTSCQAVETFPISESFDSTTFPPSCWYVSSCSYTWERIVTNNIFYIPSHSGPSATCSYKLDNTSSTRAILSTPPFILPSDAYELGLWVYRDNNTNIDSINIYISNVPNGINATNASLLGTLYNNSSLTPTVSATNQWYYYTFNFPAGSAGSYKYVVFEGVGITGAHTFIDDVKIYATPTCAKPSNLSATSITGNRVVLGWTSNGTESDWKVQYGESGFLLGTGTIVVAHTNPMTLTGLNMGCLYSYYVKADCSNSDSLGTWAGPYFFRTACDTITSFPYTEGFSNPLTTCWNTSHGTAINSTSTWLTKTNDAAHGVSGPKSGSNFMALDVYNAPSANNPYYLTSSKIKLDAIPKRATYYYYLGKTGYNSSPYPLKIQVSADDGITWDNLYNHDTTNSVFSTTNALTGWKQNAVYLDSYLNKTIMIRFVANSNTTSSGTGFCNIGVDEFVVENTPDCQPPTTSIATNILDSTALLSWTDVQGESSWLLEYGVSGFISGSGTIITTDTNSLLIHDLLPGIQYEYRLKSNCDLNLYSNWSDRFTFKTACPVVSNLSATNLTSSSAELNWDSNGSETSWIVEYGNTGFSSGTGTVLSVSSKPLIVNGLSANSSYSYYVKTQCSGTDTINLWAGPYTFYTTCNPITTFPIVESFDNTIFAPNCWKNLQTAGTGSSNIWTRETAGNYPTCTTHSGLGMASLDCYYYFTNTKAILATSPFIIDTSRYQVSFWMYRDNGYNTNKDSVNIYYNTSPSISNGILLGTINRANNYSPIEVVANQWYKYTFYLPEVPVDSYKYIVLEGVSLFGNNIYIDDLKIDKQPSCLPPANASVDNITNTSAQIKWQSSGSNFKIRYKVSDATNWVNMSSSDTSIVFSGLIPSTTYQAQIMSMCSVTDSSEWSSALFFTTNCISVLNFPFVEDFEESLFAPACWTNIQTAGVSSGSLWYGVNSGNNPTCTPYSGSKMACFNSKNYGYGTKAILATPLLNIPSIQSKLQFWMYRDNQNQYVADHINIYINNTPSTDSATFIGTYHRSASLDPINYQPNTWSKCEMNLPDEFIGNKYLIFEGVSNNGGNIYIDDIEIIVPNCPAPTDISVSDITYSSATIRWHGTGSSYKINLLNNNIITSDTVLTLTGLNVTTTYNIKIKEYCNATDSSAWSSTFSFTTTDCAPLNLPYFENFDNNVDAGLSIPACSGIDNVNMDDSRWMISSQYSYSPPNSLYVWGNGTEKNDWFYTPALNLETGKTYTVQFKYRDSGFPNENNDLIEVVVDDTASFMTMTGPAIFSDPFINGTEFQQGEGSFSVTSSGVYYVGFHGYSSYTSDYLAIDDIYIFDQNTINCEMPTVLYATNLGINSAQLNWTNGGNETAWNLQYRKSTDTNYIHLNNISTKPYILNGLEQNTAYVWNLQAICNNNITSFWSAGNSFNTAVSVAENSSLEMNVYSNNNQIHLINSKNQRIKEIVVFDMLGQQVGTYAINSTDNVLINSNLTIGNYVVKVITETKVGNYKLFIK